MKRFFLAFVFLSAAVLAQGQQITQVTLQESAVVSSISFSADGTALLRISPTGNINAYGVDLHRENGIENYEDKLSPYMGRVEFYSSNENEALRGKLKYIGRTLITYFASYEGEEFKGKIKSIGGTAIDYYSNFADPAFVGKIKSVGAAMVNWFASYENEGFRGKIKSLGNTVFTYYSSGEDKAFKGKIKSIGSAQFSYYPTNERIEYRGRLKNGQIMQFINGIRYYVRQ